MAWIDSSKLPRIERGEGIYVFDDKGNKYLDGCSGPVLFCIGHGNTEVNEAITQQLDKIAFGYWGDFQSEAAENLKKVIARHAGGGLTKMEFVSGGSEAVEACLKIALQYHVANGEPDRHIFFSRKRSYHGNTLGALGVSGFKARREHFARAVAEPVFLSAANAYRPPEKGMPADQIASYCAEEFEREVKRVGAEKIAAFIFEPVVGAAGVAVPAPPGYAKAMREVCDRHGILMIADEIMSGAGRCGTWRALEQDGVEPDIMSMAKGLGGGYLPLGAAVYQERIFNKMIEVHGAVWVGHTFTQHTSACASSLAVLNIIERDGLVAKVAENGPYLMEAMNARLGQNPHVGDIRGRGFLQGVEFVKDRNTAEPFDPALQMDLRVKQKCQENGLLVYPCAGNADGVKGNGVLVSPPYITTRAQIDDLADRLATSIEQVMADPSVH